MYRAKQNIKPQAHVAGSNQVWRDLVPHESIFGFFSSKKDKKLDWKGMSVQKQN